MKYLCSFQSRGFEVMPVLSQLHFKCFSKLLFLLTNLMERTQSVMLLPMLLLREIKWNVHLKLRGHKVFFKISLPHLEKDTNTGKLMPNAGLLQGIKNLALPLSLGP